MKKINSIHYGWIFICTGLFMGCVIPAILYTINSSFKISILSILCYICIAAGSLILVVFLLLLVVEMNQDRKIRKYYDQHRRDKIRIGENYFECAACGNRNVRKEDTYCTVCGNVFEDTNKTVSEIINHQ